MCRCEVCASHQQPLTHLPGRIKPDRGFNDTIGVDLFTLAVYASNEPIFLNQLWDCGVKALTGRVR